jgi:hypothetical protein
MEVKEFDLKMKRLDISEAVINSVVFINSANTDALAFLEILRDAVIIRYIDEALLEKLNDGK